MTRKAAIQVPPLNEPQSVFIEGAASVGARINPTNSGSNKNLHARCSTGKAIDLAGTFDFNLKVKAIVVTEIFNYRKESSVRVRRRESRQLTSVVKFSSAAAQKLRSNLFLESTGRSLKIRLPKGAKPEMNIEWKIPTDWNTFERNKARAYGVAFTAMVAMNDWMKGLDLLKKGEQKSAFS